MRVEHLRSLLELSPRLTELLHEDLAENDVVLAFERRAEDDSDTVVERANKQRLVGPVVDDGCLIRLALATLQALEVLLEDRREAVALEQTRFHRHLFPVLRQRVQVKQQRDRVVRLRWVLKVLTVLTFYQLQYIKSYLLLENNFAFCSVVK